MKIAILVFHFPPKSLAGTEIATYNIARYLAKRGHKVHVITSFDKGLPKVDIEQGFYVHRISWQRARFIRVIFFWLKILFLLKKIKPDIIHAQNIGMGVPGFLSKKLRSCSKKPYIVWCQGSDIYLDWRFKEFISKLVLKNADAVIALTEDMKMEIQKICDKEIYVIPNGIDLKRFENLSREGVRRRLKITGEQKIIMFVGTLRSVKGLKYLIQAMDIIKQKDAEVKLMLVGDGEERQDLEKLVKELDLEDRVIFVGKVFNEKVPEYMAASDVFVLPSLSESFGIVNLEAMASGLPIVATKVGGLSEIVKDGENGFLVEPKNPEQIAKKVLLILENDKLRKKISKNNKEEVKKYTWDEIANRLEKIYSGVLAKNL